MSPSPLVKVVQDEQILAVVQGDIFGDESGNGGSELNAGRATESSAWTLIAMYRKRGLEGLAELEGDFAFCLIDVQKRQAVVGRDFLGGYPLFWTVTGSGFRISSSLKPLTEDSGLSEVDPDYLAGFLMLPNAGMNESLEELSAFRGIQRVLPGQLRRFDLSGAPRSSVVASYWSRRFELSDAHTTVEDAAASVRAHLEHSVRRRLSKRVGCHFSGGIDSTGIAFLAARMAGNRSVQAFAKTFPELRSLAQEQRYIDYAASLESNLTLHRVAVPPATQYSELDSLPLYDEPHPGIAHATGSTSFCNLIAESGVTTVLTGVGGDHLFDTSLSVLIADAIAHGRFQQALSIAESAGSQLDQSRWSLIYQSFSRLLPARLQSGIGPWLHNGRAGWMNLTDQTVAPWINPRFARNHSMFDRAVAFLPNRLVHHVDAANQLNLGLIRHQSGDLQRWYPALRADMKLAHPYFDRRLLESVMRLPSRIRYRAGQQKHLLTRALRDVLPREITDRRKKGHFGELADFGFAKHQPELADLIARSSVAEDILDKAKLEQCLQYAVCGAYRDVCGLDRLNLTLSMLYWLERLPDWIAEKSSCVEFLAADWQTLQQDVSPASPSFSAATC